jgi:hypothetical protein
MGTFFELAFGLLDFLDFSIVPEFLFLVLSSHL